MRKWLACVALISLLPLSLVGCSKPQEEAPPTPTGSIDNNSQAAKDAPVGHGVGPGSVPGAPGGPGGMKKSSGPGK